MSVHSHRVTTVWQEEQPETGSPSSRHEGSPTYCSSQPSWLCSLMWHMWVGVRGFSATAYHRSIFSFLSYQLLHQKLREATFTFHAGPLLCSVNGASPSWIAASQKVDKDEMKNMNVSNCWICTVCLCLFNHISLQFVLLWARWKWSGDRKWGREIDGERHDAQMPEQKWCCSSPWLPREQLSLLNWHSRSQSHYYEVPTAPRWASKQRDGLYSVLSGRKFCVFNI